MEKKALKPRDYYETIAAIITRHKNFAELAAEFVAVLKSTDPNFNQSLFIQTIGQYKTARDLKQFVAASKN